MATMYEPADKGLFHREDVSQKKRNLNLDLSAPPIKRLRTSNANINVLLTSPDLLHLSSPTLEEMAKVAGGLYNSPGFLFQNLPTKVPTPETTNVSEEYIKQFEDTLEQYKNSGQTNVIVSLSNQAPQYTQLEAVQKEDEIQIKEEPQTVPSVCGSPPVSPVDMEEQERIKLERKRLRNRIAASKCRRRKLEKISKLESKVNQLKNENAELKQFSNNLKNTVCHLKQQVMDHLGAGCQIPFHN